MTVSHLLRTAIALASVLVLTAPSAWAGPKTVLSFAPLPMETPETVLMQVKPMLTYLEKETGSEIRVNYSSDYAEILRKFQDGTVDLAYLGPLPYLTLRDQYAQAEPLVHFLEKSGKATYTCAVIAAADGPANLSQLTGRKIGLTQALSTCGYLSTSGLLRQSSSDIGKNLFRYLGTHDEVALAVARGDFDLGGLKTAIARKYAHMGVKVVAESAPLPSFALVANKATVPAETIAKIRQALTALTPATDEGHKAMMAGWGENLRFGAIAAQDSDYDPVRQLRGSAPIPENGNF